MCVCVWVGGWVACECARVCSARLGSFSSLRCIPVSPSTNILKFSTVL